MEQVLEGNPQNKRAVCGACGKGLSSRKAFVAVRLPKTDGSLATVCWLHESCDRQASRKLLNHLQLMIGDVEVISSTLARMLRRDIARLTTNLPRDVSVSYELFPLVHSLLNRLSRLSTKSRHARLIFRMIEGLQFLARVDYGCEIQLRTSTAALH